VARVYLDHNATTPLRPEARVALLEALDQVGGNPSSVHRSGRAARALLDQARERVAAALGVDEGGVIFTSGGSEANGLALLGSLRPHPGSALVTCATEHAAVLKTAEQLEREGHPLTRVPVDGAGRVTAEDVTAAAAATGAGLVSISAANNEVGTTAPLASIAAGLDQLEVRPLLHTDGVQALGRMPVRLGDWGIDLASFSAHKLGGPFGVGVLVRRGNAPLEPLTHGGGQEFDLRPGTENVPAIVAAAVAIELAVEEQAAFARRALRLSMTLWDEVHTSLPHAVLLGPPLDAPDRLPNTVNILLPNVDGRVLVARLDLEGLEASAGSACASGSLEPSHVLMAMGLDEEHARAGLRLSIGRTTKAEDIHTAVGALRRTL
jgi:cysteine desulfurase